MKSFLKMLMWMWLALLSFGILSGGDCSFDVNGEGEGDVDVDVKPLFLE